MKKKLKNLITSFNKKYVIQTICFIFFPLVMLLFICEIKRKKKIDWYVHKLDGKYSFYILLLKKYFSFLFFFVSWGIDNRKKYISKKKSQNKPKRWVNNTRRNMIFFFFIFIYVRLGKAPHNVSTLVKTLERFNETMMELLDYKSHQLVIKKNSSQKIIKNT